jgi:AcrR family transcriptional regulator
MAQAHKLEIVSSVSAVPDRSVDRPSSHKAAGRPRSEASRGAILDATRRLMTHTSIRDLSIEAIAKKAGVGKTTIYRWWPNKVAVVIEAYADQMDMHMLTAGNESARAALIRQIERFIRQLRGKNGRIVADLLAEAQSDVRVLEQFNRFYMDSRRAALHQTIAQGQKSGDLSENMNTATAADMVLGTVILRLMSGEDAIDEAFAATYPLMAADALRA